MKKESDALRKELEKETPFLAQMKDKPEGLSVPDGYFTQLKNEVLKQTVGVEGKTNKMVRLWPRLAAAASVVLIVGLAFFLFRPNDTGINEENVAFSEDEVHDYISQNIDDFELDLLMEYVAISDQSSELFDQSDLDDPELDQYMDELLDDIDLETIEELL